MRKYTRDYYLSYIEKQNTPELFKELKNFSDTTVKDIQSRYKNLSKGCFIDYISQYEDFYMITTYRIEDMLTCAFTVIRLKNGKKHFQYYEQWYFWGEYSWQRHRFNHMNKRYLYSRNLKELFKDTEYKYSEIWELANNIDVSARNFLGYCNSHHIKYIERLTKMKCYKLAKDFINGRFYIYGDDVFKGLGFKGYKEFKPVIDEDMSIEQLRQYKNFIGLNIPKKYLKCFRYFLKWYGIDDVKVKTMSAKSFIKYFLSQYDSGLYKSNFYEFRSDYIDYCNFGTYLKYDFTNTKYSKPSNFKQAHDIASMKYKSKQALKQKKDLNKVFKLQKDFIYSGKTYSIVVPTSADDIIQEGENLSHCVGSYIDRIARGKSYIFFVRYTSDLSTSFFTLELNPETYKIEQCRGDHNKPVSEENQVQRFVKNWQKNVVEKIVKRRLEMVF